MKLEISLSPNGELRLHLPDRRARTLDIPASEAGLAYLLKLLKQVQEGVRERKGYIGEFPTQAVIDAWAKAAAVQRAEESIAAASERLGVDIEKLEISI